MLRSLGVFFLFCAATGTAYPHPGHASVAATIAEWLHLLSSPDHLLGVVAAGLLALGLAAAAAIRVLRKARR